MNSNPIRPAMSGVPVFFILFITVLLFLLFAASVYVAFVNEALLRLQLSPRAATLALAGIVVGGLINIPIHRSRFSNVQLVDWATYYVNWGSSPFPVSLLQGNIIAINIGGAIVPILISAWILPRLCSTLDTCLSLLVAVCLNVWACFRLGRLVQHIGIMLPGWLAPFIGVAMSWALLPPGSPHHAAFAFVTAVAGPLIGADLLHLKDVRRLGAGTMSIGGAGPIDGIVLSGILAAWFA